MFWQHESPTIASCMCCNTGLNSAPVGLRGNFPHPTPPTHLLSSLTYLVLLGLPKKGLSHGSGIFYLCATENKTEAAN